MAIGSLQRVAPVDRSEVEIELAPAPGVVAATDFPGLDGYRLRVVADGHQVDDVLRIVTDDEDLTATLVDDDLRVELCRLRLGGFLLDVADDRARVLGVAGDTEDLPYAAGVLESLCARPARIARRLTRLYRRYAAVASGPRWNTVDFQLTLATSPAVRVDWPRRRARVGRRVVTRLRAESAELPANFLVVDTTRVNAFAIDPGALPLDVPDTRPGRYALVADRAISVDAAAARLAPALPFLGAALPHHVAIHGSGVEVVFAGVEEQPVAIDPAVTLTRVLAGRSAHAAGPYR
jgi:hypothetical protein